MKTLLKIFFLGVLSVLLTIAASAREPQVKRDPGKKNLIVLKADKKLVGGKVEVIRSNGEVVSEQVLSRRKLYIDFNGMNVDSYTVRVVKGNESQEFQFKKL